MRTQTQCNGIWQNSADGSIMYADTAHGVLWVRHVTDTTETWNTKHIAASNLRGYLAAMRENGWLMVSANADVVPNADAYNAWRADMFPHGIPRRVTDMRRPCTIGSWSRARRTRRTVGRARHHRACRIR